MTNILLSILLKIVSIPIPIPFSLQFQKKKKTTVFSCWINTNNIENKRIQRIKSTTYPSSGLRLALKENIDLHRASSLNSFIKLVSFFNSNFTLNFRPKLFKFFPIVCKLFPTWLLSLTVFTHFPNLHGKEVKTAITKH